MRLLLWLKCHRIRVLQGLPANDELIRQSEEEFVIQPALILEVLELELRVLVIRFLREVPFREYVVLWCDCGQKSNEPGLLWNP